jgi:hypothetical protein
MKAIMSKGNTNAKTAKNKRETMILYLMPGMVLGQNMCPKATDGCLAACLNTAGRGAFSNVQNSRLAKTMEFIKDRRSFLSRCANDINKSAKKVDELAVRMNGTSDVKLVEMMIADNEIAENVVFYDYTKIPQKAGRRILPSGHKYVVTFSRSEKNDCDTLDVLKSGGIVAVVFNELPDTFHGFPVVDGDKSDDQMLDLEGGVVLGLKAKGKARKDESGFVVR